MRNTRRIIGSGLAALGLVACLSGIWVAARVGSAGFYASKSKRAEAPLQLADRAVQLNPFDSDTHEERAYALGGLNRLTESAEEYERAVQLRPRDYSLWLKLGHARDKIHDSQGALTAFREAVRLAPHYAQTRWYLGYGLLRAEKNDEGFAELRRAVEINPALLTKLFDLAADIYGGDPSSIQRRVQPQTDAVRLALARYFAEHGNVAEAAELFRMTQVVPAEDRRELVRSFLARDQVAVAYEVWSGGRASDQAGGIATFFNSGFESQLRLDESGFGWQIPRSPVGARISVDDSEPYEGGRSLHIEFAGASDPAGKLVSQLLLVEPGKRYRLSFFARTQELVTSGLSVISVMDAGDKDLPSLAHSPSLPQGTNGWQEYAVEFTSPESEAVNINLMQENCPASPCSAYGHLWLDNFSLRKQ